MTRLEELRAALDRIQNKGAINKARRRAIIIEINKMLQGDFE